MKALNARFSRGDHVVIRNQPNSIHSVISVKPTDDGKGHQYQLRDINEWFNEVELEFAVLDDISPSTSDLVEEVHSKLSTHQTLSTLPRFFDLGDIVRIKSRGNSTFSITHYRPLSNGDFEYFVKDIGWCMGQDLIRVDDNKPAWRKKTDFLRDLFLAKMASPLTDSLYSYRASRTEFQAYQFKPLLKFLNNPERRLLIADEVGLGKTIEAAIIYLELKARLNISRILVVCPSRLTQKWQDELLNRFDERFDIWDTRGIERALRHHKHYGEGATFRAIVSFETLRQQQHIEAFETSGMGLDLLIVDEAHHMRNRSTQTYRLGEVLQSNADAALFLTATPLNLGEHDLFNLMHLLAPEQFEEYEQFQETIEPNRFINQAGRYLIQGLWDKALSSLRDVEMIDRYQQFKNNPFYQKVVTSLRQPTNNLETLIRLHRELLNLNTLASHFTRTRKREALDGPPTRRATPVIVTLTPTERAFYDGVLAYTKHLAQERHGFNYGFFVVTTERMAASCLPAAIEAFGAEQGSHVYLSLKRFEHEDNIYDSTLGDDNGDENPHTQPLIPTPEELLRLGQQVKVDSKFDKFLAIIQQIIAEDAETKVLVFSSYRRTLKYLKDRLDKHGFAVDTIHGEIKIAQRYLIIDQFREGTIQILLSSEVGAEGLDFQFCHVLVNYDLPWNPMQVEQRIGRLDRFGQQSSVIRIFNLYIEDTIETRIFQRLYERIHIFEDSIGDLEAILGKAIRELTQSVLQKDLTPQEQERLADETAKRIMNQQIDQEAFERERDNLIGQDQFLQQELNTMISTGRIIHPAETCAILQTYLKKAFPKTVFQEEDRSESIWYMHLSSEFKEEIRHFENTHKLKLTDGVRIALQKDHLRLTFDSVIAQQGRELEFITPYHPFIFMARHYWNEEILDGIPATRAVIIGPPHEAGLGNFFVYAIDVKSAQPRRTLHTVILLDDGQMAIESARNLLKQIHEDTPIPRVDTPSDETMFEAETELQSYIREQRNSIEQEARERNEELIQNRLASIERGFNIGIRQAEKIAVENIREGRIRNLRAKRDRRLKELDELRDIAVSYKLIACGRVLIEPDPTKTRDENEPIYIEDIRGTEFLPQTAPLVEQLHLITDTEMPETASIAYIESPINLSVELETESLIEHHQQPSKNEDKFEQLRNRMQRAANAMIYRPQGEQQQSYTAQALRPSWLQRVRGWISRKSKGDNANE